MIVKYHYLIMDAVDWTPYEGFVYHFDQSRDIAELFLWPISWLQIIRRLCLITAS